MPEAVVTEIQISSAQLEAALARVEGAYAHLGDRAVAAEARAQAALEKTVQSLKGVPQSVERVQASYDRLRASLDPVFATQLRGEQEMTRSLAAINRAVLLNVTTEEQAAKDIAALRSRQISDIERFRAAQAAGRGTGGANQFGIFNSAQQFQDIAVTAMMGQNLATIGLQQGLQLGTGMQLALGEKGAAGAVKVLSGALTSLLSPINLIAIAGTVAAAGLIQWFTSAGDSVDEVKAKTDDYLKSVDAISAGMGRAGKAVDEFGRKSSIELDAAERRARAILEITAQNQNKDLLGELNPLNTGTLFGSFQSSNVKSVFSPFQSAIDELRKGLRAGNPDFDAFEKHIQAISATDPRNLNRWGDELIRTAEQAANTNRILTGTADGLRDLSTINPNTVAVQQAIQDIGTTAEGVTVSIKNLIMQGQAITNMLAGMDALARGVAPKGDAVSGKGSLDRAQDSFDEAFTMFRRFGYDNDSKIDPNTPKKQRVDHSAERAANAYRDLIKSADDRIAQMRLEAEVSGMVGIAADTMRFKLDLLQKGEEKGRTLSPAQRAEIEKKAEAYEKVAIAAAKANLQQNLTFERDQMFRNPIDQRIASQLRGAGLEVDFNSYEAGLIRMNEQLGIARDLSLDFASGLSQDLRNGVKPIDAITNAFGRLADKLLDMAMNNAINGLFSNLAGGLGGGAANSNDPWSGMRSTGSSGGILGSIFSWLGFADGGMVRGPGSSTSDSIPAWLSNGEFVVNAAATRAYRPMLEAMNQNAMPHNVVRLAAGTPTRLAPTMALGGQQRVQIDVGVYVNDDGTLGAIAREAGKDGGAEAADVRVRVFSQNELPDRMNQINAQPRRRGAAA